MHFILNKLFSFDLFPFLQTGDHQIQISLSTCNRSCCDVLWQGDCYFIFPFLWPVPI